MSSDRDKPSLPDHLFQGVHCSEVVAHMGECPQCKRWLEDLVVKAANLEFIKPQTQKD